MKNSLVLLAVVLSVAAFAGMMRIKTDVQTMDRERMRLVRERAELRETKRVLEAEWALLASPERLAKLVRGQSYEPASALDIVPLNVPVSATAIVSPVAVVTTAEVLPVAATPSETAAMGSAIEAVEALQEEAQVSATEEVSGSAAGNLGATERE